MRAAAGRLILNRAPVEAITRQLALFTDAPLDLGHKRSRAARENRTKIKTHRSQAQVCVNLATVAGTN